MSDYISGRIVCPFYKDIVSNRQTIVCEGIDDDSSTCLVFDTKQKMKNHINLYCCNVYKYCLISDMLNRMYGDD